MSYQDAKNKFNSARANSDSDAMRRLADGLVALTEQIGRDFRQVKADLDKIQRDLP